jgi:hypothetical protein
MVQVGGQPGCHSSGSRANAMFAVDSLEVRPHRSVGDPKPPADLLVGQIANEKLEDLGLTRSQLLAIRTRAGASMQEQSHVHTIVFVFVGVAKAMR